MPLLRLVATAALVAAVAGCGGSPAPSDREQVAGVLRTFLHAEADGDGATACRQLTGDARRAVLALVRERARGLGAAPRSCEEAAGLVRAVAPAGFLAALRAARVQAVAVRGTRATARVLDGRVFPPQRVALVKTAAGWRIAAVPTLTAR